ncbi:MAG: PEGA domain-containing protein [Myxococcaceae bacterium]
MPPAPVSHCNRCGAVTSDDENTHRCARPPPTTLVDEEEPDKTNTDPVQGVGPIENTDTDPAAAAVPAESPSSSLAPLDTLDTPGGDSHTGGGQRPGETLILPEGDEPAEDAEAGAGLGPGFGSLRVVALLRGAPTQANVTIDGVSRGPSPLVLAVLPGQHQVKLERVGFGAAEKSVLVRAAGEQTLVELEVKSAKQR